MRKGLFIPLEKVNMAGSRQRKNGIWGVRFAVGWLVPCELALHFFHFAFRPIGGGPTV